MEPSLFLSTFALIFLAELGDKSQLMAITLASRYRALPVVVGTFSAFALLNMLGVLFGGSLATLVPRSLLLASAGILFLVFAWQSWREADRQEDAGRLTTARRGAIATSFGLIFLAEFGDKTQLAVVAIASRGEAPGTVFSAATAAEWLLALIGILIGGALLRRLPTRYVHRAAALLFGVFGLVALLEAWRSAAH